jgi:hypothetical protein
MTIMPFDELNRFEAEVEQHFETDTETGKRKIKSQQDCDDIIDEMMDLFLMAYSLGFTSTQLDLGTEVEMPFDDMMAIIDKEIAGKTWRQRVQGYYEDGGDVADIMRIATTESHRDANAAAYETAKKAGATEKVWHCMMLPTSRDTHVYLNGVTAPINGVFYNYKGESTYYPGQWGIAEEDINCLCWLTYKK